MHPLLATLTGWRGRRRRASTKVSTDETGRETPHRRPRRRQSLIAARCHARQRERRTQQSPRQAVHLSYVIQGITTYQLGVSTISIENRRTFQVHSITSSNAEIASHIFKTITGHIAHNEVVAAHRIERIDQLTSSHTIASAPTRLWSYGQRFLTALQRHRPSVSTQRQPHPQHSSPLLHKRQLQT